ncbi:MAG TPA: hypothetical protein PLP83_06995 [Candidatus Aminicenantes bacterium]|nr:hypothetical protein [Candidatus Aminicenantes bacterium]
MGRKALAFAFLGAVAVAVAGRAEAADRTGPAQRQAGLAAEYGLAKESQFYFVLDVPGRKLDLRVRGMVLKSWPLRDMRFWGDPGFAGTVALAKKTTLKSPERIVLRPGEAKEAGPAPAPAKPVAKGAAPNPAEYELEALELKDMPKAFGLDFDNGLHVSVKARDAAAQGLSKRLRGALRWYVGLPLRNLFGTKEGKALSELELVFESGQDAQAIYWHFFDGIRGIILP